MPQFGNSGDKIAQTVAVARYILQEGSFSATSGLFEHNWGGGLAPDPVCLGSSETTERSI